MIEVSGRGLRDFDRRLKLFPRITRKAAKLAINTGARRGRTLASKEIRKQINFTAGYLNSQGRLYVSKFASDVDLEAKISARVRPTQLSRFMVGQRYVRGKTVSRKPAGVYVRVKAGGSRKLIRQGFLVSLRRGDADSGNVGIAVRDTEGLNLKKGKKSSSGFQVLYAPSVDQVFRDVRQDVLPEINDRMSNEFDRQFGRLI